MNGTVRILLYLVLVALLVAAAVWLANDPGNACSTNLHEPSRIA